MDVLAAFVASLNRSLLLESEKPTHFFGFDLSEFTKADVKERWEAWKIAKEGGFVMVDEVRKSENMPPLGMEYTNMGLQDVLFDAKRNRIIVPNMGKVIDLDDLQPYEPGERPASDDGNVKEPTD